jgi:hypothetical protein
VNSTTEELALEALSEVQRRAADALGRDGLAVLPFADLFDEQLWAEALDDVAPFTAEAARAGTAAGGPSKGDLILSRFELIGRKSGDVKKQSRVMLPMSSPWIRIGSSDALLDIVNTYRGLLTRLKYVDNWYTVPRPAAEKRVFSQRWHRDPEDQHCVKVFLYLSDVDAEGGPFQYILSSSSGGRYGHLWPWGEGARYPAPEALEERVAAEDIVTLTGPAGTLIICDTGGFHRGGFAKTRPRVLATWTYVAHDARKKRRRYTITPADPPGLSAQAQAALLCETADEAKRLQQDELKSFLEA